MIELKAHMTYFYLFIIDIKKITMLYFSISLFSTGNIFYSYIHTKWLKRLKKLSIIFSLYTNPYNVHIYIYIIQTIRNTVHCQNFRARRSKTTYIKSKKVYFAKSCLGRANERLSRWEMIASYRLLLQSTW